MRRVISGTATPEMGETRIAKEFLFLPKTLPWCADLAGCVKVWRWLEIAEVQQEYIWGRARGLKYPMWVDIAWADLNTNVGN